MIHEDDMLACIMRLIEVADTIEGHVLTMQSDQTINDALAKYKELAERVGEIDHTAIQSVEIAAQAVIGMRRVRNEIIAEPVAQAEAFLREAAEDHDGEA